MRRVVVVAAVLAALAFAVQAGEYSTLDLLRQRRQRARLLASVDSLTRVVDSLKRYHDGLLHDPRLQERIAREEFGMVRGGELLYRFAEPTAAPGEGAARR